MARINIEECWWSDPRRDRLIQLVGGDAQKGDGVALRMWRLAQEFWKHGKSLIPLHLVQSVDNHAAFIECQLGEIRNGFVYVRGSSAYFEWVRESREAARKGGQKSADVRRKKYGNAQPQSAKTSKRTRSDSEADSKSLEPSVSASSSVSDSDSDSEITLRVQENANAFPVSAPRGKKFNEETGRKMQAFIGEYARGWKTKYGATPEGIRDKAIIGKIGHWIGTVSEERALSLIQIYLQIDYRSFSESYHDLWQFFRHLNRIGAALQSGTTAGQVNWNEVFAGA